LNYCYNSVTFGFNNLNTLPVVIAVVKNTNAYEWWAENIILSYDIMTISKSQRSTAAWYLFFVICHISVSATDATQTATMYTYIVETCLITIIYVQHNYRTIYLQYIQVNGFGHIVLCHCLMVITHMTHYGLEF